MTLAMWSSRCLQASGFPRFCATKVLLILLISSSVRFAKVLSSRLSLMSLGSHLLWAPGSAAVSALSTSGSAALR